MGDIMMQCKTKLADDGIFCKVVYGFNKLGTQKSYLSITGEVWEGMPKHNERNLISCGCVHDYILQYFPEFKNIIPFHLCDIDAPMHYIANAIYFHEMATGNMEKYSWFDPTKDTPEKGKKYFARHVIEHVAPIPSDIWEYNKTKLQSWLHNRLPIIMEAMRQECKNAGIRWPAD